MNLKKYRVATTRIFFLGRHPISFSDLPYEIQLAKLPKVNRDRYNLDAPRCKKKADMDLDLRTWNDKERFSESILNSS